MIFIVFPFDKVEPFAYVLAFLSIRRHHIEKACDLLYIVRCQNGEKGNDLEKIDGDPILPAMKTRGLEKNEHQPVPFIRNS